VGRYKTKGEAGFFHGDSWDSFRDFRRFPEIIGTVVMFLSRIFGCYATFLSFSLLSFL